MEKKKILVVSNSALLLVPTLEKSLNLINPDYKVDFSSDFTPEEADLIFADYNILNEKPELKASMFKHTDKLTIMTALVDHTVMNEIIEESHVHHLLGLSGPNSLSDIRDLIVAQFNHQFWTTETFIKAPNHMTQTVFESSQGVSDKIDILLKGHNFSSYFSGIEDYLTQIMNESIMNALYNAPVNKDGEKFYCQKNRSEVIHMLPDKQPEVKLMTDSKKVVISVKDYYGSLTEKDVFDYLPQGEIREKKGGAGIGMYLIFKYAHKLIINIEKGVSTEVIILIEEDKRFKWYSTKEKSFHLFVK